MGWGGEGVWGGVGRVCEVMWEGCVGGVGKVCVGWGGEGV